MAVIEVIADELATPPPAPPAEKPEEPAKEAEAESGFEIEYEDLGPEDKPQEVKAEAEPSDKKAADYEKKLAEKDQELLKLSWRLEQLEKDRQEKPAPSPPKKEEEQEYTDQQLKAYLEEHDNSPEAQIQVHNYIAKREARKERAAAEQAFAATATAKEFRDLEAQVLGKRSDLEDPVIVGKVRNLRSSLNLDQHPGGNLLAYALFKLYETESAVQKKDAQEARDKKARAANLDRSKTPPKPKEHGLTPEHLAVAEKLGLKDLKLYSQMVAQAGKE